MIKILGFLKISKLKNAEMGLGVLISLITIILVAAVSAGVLINTSGVLSQKSLITGQTARKKITNHIMVDYIKGVSNEQRQINSLIARMSLTPGSDPVSLETTTVTDITTTGTGTYSYKKDSECIYDVLNGYFIFNGDPITYQIEPFVESRSNKFDFSSSETSEFLAGKVAVAVVFIESDGTIDASTEDWTPIRQERVINGLQNGFNWWRAREPRADIEYAFEIYRSVPVSYEPISRDLSFSTQELWVNEALDYIGAPSGSNIFERSRSFDNYLRDKYNAHWGFILFVTENENDADGYFLGTQRGSYFYDRGPFAIMAPNVLGTIENVDAHSAHVIGGVFGASAEYQGSNCGCYNTSGFFQTQAFNCKPFGGGRCLLDETSIMRFDSDMVTAYENGMVDYYARIQMGLIDTNENNLIDPIEVHFFGDSDLTDTEKILNYQFDEYVEDDKKEGFFSVESIYESSTQKAELLAPGQAVKVCFKPSTPLVDHDLLDLHISPIKGQLAVANVKLPDVIPKSEHIIIYEAFK